MSGSKARRKGRTSHRAQRARYERTKRQRVVNEETGRITTPDTLMHREKREGIFGLVMSGMVALGCWGFAYSFTLLNDPNRYLFAGMAVLIALMWSVSFFVRFRRWQRRR